MEGLKRRRGTQELRTCFSEDQDISTVELCVSLLKRVSFSLSLSEPSSLQYDQDASSHHRVDGVHSLKDAYIKCDQKQEANYTR